MQPFETWFDPCLWSLMQFLAAGDGRWQRARSTALIVLSAVTCFSCGGGSDNSAPPPSASPNTGSNAVADQALEPIAQVGRVSVRIVNPDGSATIPFDPGILVQFVGDNDFSMTVQESNFSVDLGAGRWEIVALMGTCNTYPAAEVRVTGGIVVELMLTMHCNA